MKCIKSAFLSIIVFTFIFTGFGCSSNCNRNDLINSNFETLIKYCKSFNQDSEDCYSISWYNYNISENFTLSIYEDKKIEVVMSNTSPYNSGINIENFYCISFYYGAEIDNILEYSITVKSTMIKLKDQYNYYEYILDEDIFYDTKAKFNTINFIASCSFEDYETKNDCQTYPNPNKTLMDISVDCFKSLKQYLFDNVKISLFV